MLLDNGAKERDLNEYYKEFKSGEYANTTVVTVGESQSSSQGGETVPADTEAPVDTGADRCTFKIHECRCTSTGKENRICTASVTRRKELY